MGRYISGVLKEEIEFYKKFRVFWDVARTHCILYKLYTSSVLFCFVLT
jgi:hypothetical protein